MPFNTVLVYCRCGQCTYFQSKATETLFLGQFTASEVPLEMANDLDGRAKHCPRCDRLLTLRKLEALYTPMEVDYGSEEAPGR